MTFSKSTQTRKHVLYRFYCGNCLANQVQGESQFTFFQCRNQLLAQLQCDGAGGASEFLAVDQQRTVLNSCVQLPPSRALCYTPYGYRLPHLNLLGFNGEPPDTVTGHYLLGNGLRAFNPALMRFNSPDSISPFWFGGLNSYSYCLQDPVNYQDPSGNSRLGRFMPGFFSRFKRTRRPPREVLPAAPSNVNLISVRPLFETNKGFGKFQGPVISETNVSMNEVTGRTETNGYVLLGFHGSSEQHKQSLLKGVDINRNVTTMFGRGFYYTEKIETAMFYARDRGGSQGYVYGVYGKVPLLKEHVDIIAQGHEVLVFEGGIKHIIVRDFIMHSPGQKMSEIRQ